MSSRGLLGSIAVIGGAQAVILAISLVRVKMLAVLLGPAGVGLLGAFNNLQQTAMLVTGLGLMTSGTREVARTRENPPELSAIRCALVAGLWAQGAVAVAVVWIFREPLSVLLLGDPGYAFQTGLVGVAALIGLLSQSQLIQLQGMSEVPRLAQATVAGALAGTAFGLIAVLVSGRDGVIWFVIAQPLVTAAVAFARMPRLPRLGRSLPAGQAIWRVWRRMVGLGASIMLGGLSITVAVLLVRGIVAQKLGLEAAGHFAAAWSLTLLSVGFLLNAMNVDYFPRLSAVVDDRTAASALMNDQMQIGLAIGGPIMLLLIGLAPLAVRILYAADFAPAVRILQWQSLGNLFMLACWPAIFVLAAAGRSGLFFIAQACFGSVFVLLVWLLAPRVGLDICGIAFAAGHVVQFGLAMILLRRMRAVAWERRSLRLFAGFACAASAELAVALVSPVWGAVLGIGLAAITGVFSAHLLVGRTGAAVGILRQIARLYAAVGWPVARPRSKCAPEPGGPRRQGGDLGAAPALRVDRQLPAGQAHLRSARDSLEADRAGMMRGTISVAMATFNGGRFLRQQLDSLATLTRLPDELVITDDGSTDDTLAIAGEFARRAPFPVRIVQNAERLGYARNFGRAVSICTGDIIFLCDQDDVWHPEKLATVEAYFRDHPEILVVINDAELVDEALAGSDPPRTQLSQLRALGLPAEREHITGCCTAFRSVLRDLLCPIPDGETGHDNWLHALARRLGSRAVIPDVLQLHRRHEASSAKWIGGTTARLGRADLIRTFLNRDPRPGCERRRRELVIMEERIRGAAPGFWAAARLPVTAADLIAGIDRDRAAIERRRRLLHRPRWQRLWPALMMLAGGRYREFQGWKTFMMDSFIYR